MKTTKPSIWIIPTEPLLTELKNLIVKYADDFKSPKFTPHLTLLGEVDNPEKIKELVDKIHNFNVLVKEVTYSDKYFQCVFALVEKSEPLMNANKLAREIFQRQNDPEFTPHISLIYGTVDKTIKKQICEELGSIDTSFSVDKIYLVSPGEPEKWEIIEEYEI